MTTVGASIERRGATGLCPPSGLPTGRGCDGDWWKEPTDGSYGLKCVTRGALERSTWTVDRVTTGGFPAVHPTVDGIDWDR